MRLPWPICLKYCPPWINGKGDGRQIAYTKYRGLSSTYIACEGCGGNLLYLFISS